MPGGALVDAARSERLVAGIALSFITLSALAYASWPFFPIVLGAAAIHAAASCVLGPCIVAMTLGLVGHSALGDRLGRNARFAAIGNGIAAAAMGACGYLFSPRAVFFVTAALLLPTLWALARIRPSEVDAERAHGSLLDVPIRQSPTPVKDILRKGPLLILAGCLLLFHLANGAMLPLMGSVVTMRSSEWATVLIAACIVVPQVIVAAISPWVGHQAQVRGRRIFLLVAFMALVARGLLFAAVQDPYLIVIVQALDGVTGAALGVMVPLMVADITHGTGRFNLSQGIIGSAIGIGASISPTVAGYLTDEFGNRFAFLGLAAFALAGLCAVWLLMPETRPAPPAYTAHE
jgi:predicted MFS family arabinose efflux permease